MPGAVRFSPLAARTSLSSRTQLMKFVSSELVLMVISGLLATSLQQEEDDDTTATMELTTPPEISGVVPDFPRDAPMPEDEDGSTEGYAGFPPPGGGGPPGGPQDAGNFTSTDAYVVVGASATSEEPGAGDRPGDLPAPDQPGGRPDPPSGEGEDYPFVEKFDDVPATSASVPELSTFSLLSLIVMLVGAL